MKNEEEGGLQALDTISPSANWQRDPCSGKAGEERREEIIMF